MELKCSWRVVRKGAARSKPFYVCIILPSVATLSSMEPDLPFRWTRRIRHCHCWYIATLKGTVRAKNYDRNRPSPTCRRCQLRYRYCSRDSPTRSGWIYAHSQQRSHCLACPDDTRRSITRLQWRRRHPRRRRAPIHSRRECLARSLSLSGQCSGTIVASQGPCYARVYVNYDLPFASLRFTVVFGRIFTAYELQHSGAREKFS